MARNSNLSKAKDAKQDEYYTQLSDIERELRHYKEHFKGKTVFCNCDDPYESNFFKYFAMNFNVLGLKKLICTCYETSPISQTQLSLFEEDCYDVNKTKGSPAYKAVLTEIHDQNGDGAIDLKDVELTLQKKGVVTRMKGDGDFRSEESIELLKEADIVVTNPPFSLSIDYFKLLISHKKKFLVICNPNALHYKEIFPLFQANEIWIGYKSLGADMLFDVSKDLAEELVKTKKEGSGYKIIDGVIKGRARAIWVTNLDIAKRHEELELIEKYNPEKYPTYMNFNAIDVSKVTDIPCDYMGMMGVPDGFLEYYNPDQFELIGIGSGEMAKSIGVQKNYRGRTDIAYLKNGVPSCPYSRIIIKRKTHISN